MAIDPKLIEQMLAQSAPASPAVAGDATPTGTPLREDVKLLILQLKNWPALAALDDEEIQTIAEGIIAKGGHPAAEMPEGGV